MARKFGFRGFRKPRFRGFKKFRFGGRRFGGGGGFRRIFNAPFNIIRRPLGRSSGRNWMGISVAGWVLVGVLLFLFVKPVKEFFLKLVKK